MMKLKLSSMWEISVSTLELRDDHRLDNQFIFQIVTNFSKKKEDKAQIDFAYPYNVSAINPAASTSAKKKENSKKLLFVQ